MNIIVITSSHSEASRSRAAAEFVARQLGVLGATARILDLARLGADAYPGPDDHPARDEAVEAFEAADAHVVCTPVHNWGPAATTLAFLSHALDPDEGRRFRPALVIGGAGSSRSLLALDGLVRTLMTEIDAVVVGKPLILAGSDVDKSTGTLAPKAAARVERSVAALFHLAGAGSS